MGTPKACLEWYGSTLLYRAAALLGRTVRGPVVVVVGAPLGPAEVAGPVRTPAGSSKGCEVGSAGVGRGS
jgi:molybdenum cofactor guanylyltransferase